MYKPKIRNTDTYRFAPAHIKEVYGHNELYFRLQKPVIKVYGQVRGRLSLDTLEKDRPKIVKHCDWLVRELDSDIMGRICSEYSNHVNAINIDTTYGDHKIYIYSLDTLSNELEKYSHRDYLIPWKVELELRQNNRDLIQNQRNMESWFRFLYDDSRNLLEQERATILAPYITMETELRAKNNILIAELRDMAAKCNTDYIACNKPYYGQ